MHAPGPQAHDWRVCHGRLRALRARAAAQGRWKVTRSLERSQVETERKYPGAGPIGRAPTGSSFDRALPGSRGQAASEHAEALMLRVLEAVSWTWRC